MGKTTLGLRLAQALSKGRSVRILDQTGEYCGRRGLPAYDSAKHDAGLGLSVFEPSPGSVFPVEGLKHLKQILELGLAEYAKGDTKSRVLVIDEAHQFVPEPTILGFHAPGRDAALAFGLTMMQVRKYGIAIHLISQRTAVVAKSALSQCENIIAFKSVDQTSLEYLEAAMGGEIRDRLPSLSQGEALVFGPAFSCDTAVAIRIDAPVADVSKSSGKHPARPDGATPDVG